MSIESNSLDILAEDGRPLFSITLNKDGGIDVHTYMVCKHNDIMLDTGLQLLPKSTNTVTINRKLWE